MSPEIVGAVLQFGAMGLLGLAVYLGLQQMARKDEIQAEALKAVIDALTKCMDMKAEIDTRLENLEKHLPK